MNTKTIAWITGSLTLLMALFSFVLSFNALTDLAAKHGVSIPPLFPLVVEAGVVIFSLNALYRSLHGESARWQWALIIGSSLLAGVFNVAHAQADLLSQAMAAMPSLFLLLSFETFLGQIKHAVRLSTIVKSIVQLTQEFDTKRQELDTLIANKQTELDALVSTKLEEVDTLSKELDAMNVKRDELTGQVEALKADMKMLKIEKSNTKFNTLGDAKEAKRQERLDALRGYLLDNPQANLTEAAAHVGVSRQTAGEYVKELGLHRNGNGWEVISQ